MSRIAVLDRTTKETRVTGRLELDGSGQVEIATGIGFLDHMLGSLAFHAGWNLTLRVEGDLAVDDHHTAEDAALTLGAGLDAALGDRAGLVRFGSAYAPLDESLARAVVDVSGRPYGRARLRLRRERLGELATENLEHAIESLAVASRSTLHVTVLRGRNDHHKAEAAYKAMALAWREALVVRATAVPSTKGVLV